MIISRTPLRISFFGGGTDFPEYFNDHDGLVVGSSVDKAIHHTISFFSKELFGKSIRFSTSQIYYANHLDEIDHNPFKEILKHFNLKSNIEVNLASDLPSFSGMGSSSSFSVGLINCVNTFLKNEPLSKQSLADLTITIERDRLKEYVGFQDQIFAAYGGFNVIRFSNNSFEVEPIKVSQDRVEQLFSSLFLVYTGIKRKANDVEKNKYQRLTEEKINHLKTIKKIAEEGLLLINSAKNLDEFGELLDFSWQTKAKLSSEVSNEKIDQLYQMGKESGAVGGKLLGAGGGGFLLFYVPLSQKDVFKEKMKNFYLIKVQPEYDGSKILINSP